MRIKANIKTELNWFAEFKDKNTEEKYFNSEREPFIKRTKMFLVIAGVLYFLFIIPDYFLIHDATTFSQILANRLVMSFMAVLLYKVIGTIENRAVLCGLITFYEAIIALSFCVIFGQ